MMRHISTYMLDVLHWLPITAWIHYKILFLVSKAQLSIAPKYLSDYMQKPLSATSSHSLTSADWLDLFVPRTRTALAQRRAFAVAGPSTWNNLPSSLRATLMTGFSSLVSRSLKTFLFPRGFRAESASE